MPRPRSSVLVAGLATAVLGALVAPPAGAQPVSAPSPQRTMQSSTADAAARSSASRAVLAPRTHFTMKPDGSSGRTQGGEGIPNIDSVKKTIATYYGDPGTGIASKTTSPYISQMRSIVRRQEATLQKRYDKAVRHHQKPTLVFDTDDTTLFTYDMEVSAMHFTFSPAIQQQWIDDQRFAATPAMVDYVNRAAKIGYTIVGLTGRKESQEALTLANLKKVGYKPFTAKNFYTKWEGTKPSYIRCVDPKACTTVEYKAGTRRYLETKKKLTIVANYGDQWSDLQGGHADHAVKLPNPTYYLPSPNLPGVKQKKLSPRTHFTMAPDGSSGQYVSGEGIPNIDSVKKTIAVYYGDPGTGIADKKHSPYISEVKALAKKQRAALKARYRAAVARGEKPALVFDTDDTTLFTYDMEVAAMHFTFDPALQDEWVQDQRFPATPAMVTYVKAAQKAGFTIFGLTGRNDGQKAATIANLAKVGYPADAFVADRFFTKPVKGQPYASWVTGCVAAPTCTTIEYKSQTRAHIEDDLGYTVVANYGDQYSDLLGGYADRAVKLPNPTYYLP